VQVMVLSQSAARCQRLAALTGDIKKAKDAGFHTCQALLMNTRKVRIGSDQSVSHDTLVALMASCASRTTGRRLSSASLNAVSPAGAVPDQGPVGGEDREDAGGGAQDGAHHGLAVCPGVRPAGAMPNPHACGNDRQSFHSFSVSIAGRTDVRS